MKFLIILSFLLLTINSCNLKKNNDKVTTQPIKVIEKKYSFFDSIQLKRNIDFEIMKSFSNLDSGYFTERSEFIGDTIYFPKSRFPLLLIDYTDKLTMSIKFLFVYDTTNKRNVDFKIIKDESDKDFSASNYSFIDFKILSNSDFIISEESFKKTQNGVYKKSIETKKYTLNKYGKIKSN